VGHAIATRAPSATTRARAQCNAGRRVIVSRVHPASRGDKQAAAARRRAPRDRI
jgi:hypothetical protein